MTLISLSFTVTVIFFLVWVAVVKLPFSSWLKRFLNTFDQTWTPYLKAMWCQVFIKLLKNGIKMSKTEGSSLLYCINKCVISIIIYIFLALMAGHFIWFANLKTIKLNMGVIVWIWHIILSDPPCPSAKSIVKIISVNYLYGLFSLLHYFCYIAKEY